MARVLLATGDRFGRLGAEAGEEIEWSLEGTGAASLAVDPHDRVTVYVGRHGGGVVRGSDGGRTWQDTSELPERDVFSVAVSPADGALYVGTEPSRLFRSREIGDSFEELTALQEISSRARWSFPPGRGPRTYVGPRPTPTRLNASSSASSSVASCSTRTAGKASPTTA